MVQNGLPQRISQRVPVSPGVYTVSGWVRTQSLTIHSVLTANQLDAGGAVLRSDVVARVRGNSPYAYYQITLDVPATVAYIEMVGTLAGSGNGKAMFDDLRVRDRNLLENGRFELRPRAGQDRFAPGWAFGRGGTLVERGE